MTTCPRNWDSVIAVPERSAYELWLTRNIRNAELIRFKGGDETFKRFVEDKFDALAGLRPRLIEDHAKLPGSILLNGNFTAVQQAAGTPKGRAAAFASACHSRSGLKC